MSALFNGPNRVGAPTFSPEDGNRSSIRNVVSFRILDDGPSLKTSDPENVINIDERSFWNTYSGGADLFL
jgi:hypothetical protein